jgi:putative phosphoesterase
MKIGLISDIHADLKALKRALDILKGQAVDSIICLGDLVDKGREGDAVVKRIRDKAIPCVIGNHDWQAAANQRWRHASPREPLSDETLAYLRELPETLTYTWENRRVLVAHGTPWSYNEYLFSYSPPEMFRQVAKFAETDVILLGHTHEPMIALVGQVSIFNPGSVCGRHSYGSATCATLALPDCIFHVFNVRNGERIQPAYIELV